LDKITINLSYAGFLSLFNKKITCNFLQTSCLERIAGEIKRREAFLPEEPEG